MLQTVIFPVALTALAALNVLLLLTIFTTRIKLWPTPGPGSWQNYTFWPLFRGGMSLTILYVVIEVIREPGWLAIALGLPLAAGGLAVLIYGYFNLGIKNTYGSDSGLVTGGLYRYSRNPQYVASITALAGAIIAAHDGEATVLCALAILVYVLLPFAEEPWLAKAYGEAFDRYKAVTPRFL